MAATDEAITIEKRFCGPPISGNGGWTAGAVAAQVEGPAVVSLRRPPPLDTPMTVERRDDGSVAALDGEDVVAVAAPADPLEIDDVPPVTVTQAHAAVEHYLSFTDDHPFRTCFVCGPDREPGDGLRIFSGKVPGATGIVAAPWMPDPSLAADDGTLDPRALWAALDCPGGLTHMLDGRTCVLARHAVRPLHPVAIGTTYLVVGWSGECDGRKLPSRTALLDPESGETLAVGESLWIEVDPSAFT